MIWRVHAALAFNEYDEALDFFHDCEIAHSKAVDIKPGQPDEEKGYAFLEECYHDQDPSLPCKSLKQCLNP